MRYIIALSSSSAAPYSDSVSAAIMPQSSSGREYLTVRSPRYIWFNVYSSDVSVCSRLSVFSSHSHTVMQCHPMAASSCCTLLSRCLLRFILAAQKSTLLFGILKYLHPSCPCQKQPFTKMHVRYLRSTMSGCPGRRG